MLEAADAAVALVSCDLIGLTHQSVAAIRERAESMCGIPGSNILLTTTHTHSGPAMGCLRLLGQDPEWIAGVERKVAGAIAEAQRNLVEAKLGVGLGDAAFVTTPGETFIELAQALGGASTFARTFVTGHTNGVIGYLATDTAFEEDGYEVENGYKFYYGTYSLAPRTEQTMVEASIHAAKAVA